MCGITGIIHRDPTRRASSDTLRAMADTIRHRGPDDEGVYVDGPVGLAHRRLSILDLSPAGHQPMSNEDGSVWIVFNGEIYNFQSLRRELEGRHAFRSHCDTEVLVHLYEELGPAMVERLDGMFAFVVWDARRRRVLAARDHFGIKPLYYALDGERLVFGSELAPVLASGLVGRALDPAGVNDFFDLLWIPAPRTVYREVAKLPPAHTLELELDTWRVTTRRFWAPRYQPREGRSLASWVDDVGAALDRSVQMQMVADVPVATFLSGGVDSSLVSAAAARAVPEGERLRTFTIEFDDAGFSERPWAERVARALDADATWRTARPASLDALPTLARHYGEPFADSSMLPTWAVCAMARERVTVTLSGDGGDELFSGYRHHVMAHHVSRLDHLPSPVTRGLFGGLASVLPAGLRARDWSERLALDADWRRFSLMRLPGRATRLSLLAPGLRESREERLARFDDVVREGRGAPPVTQAQLFDIAFYLPNDMLVKVDRASMAHSLEVRVPFLSPAVADLALSIPEAVRFGRAEDKRVLRTLMARRFGHELAWRQKKGFGVPLRRWMRDAVTPEAEAALRSSEAVRQGVLDERGVASLFADIREGGGRWRHDRSEELFALLCFDAWWRVHAGAVLKPV